MSTNQAKAESFIKDVLRESGDSHNIFTPFALCEEVISKIPSLDGNILVVANLEFLYSLAQKGVDRSRLFFATPNDMKANGAEQMGVRVYKYKNVITKEDVGDMKFDVVVMNPPFNDEGSTKTVSGEAGKHRHRAAKLHVHFINAVMNMNVPHIAVICPIQGWLLRGSKTADSLYEGKRIQSVDILRAADAEKVFGATVGVTGILHITHTPNDRMKVFQNGTFIIEQDADHPIILGTTPTATSIITKAAGSSSIAHRMMVSRGLPRSQAAAAINEMGPTEFVDIIGGAAEPLHVLRGIADLADSSSSLYVTPSKQYTEDPFLNEYRIGINQNGRPHALSAMKIIPPNVVTSYSVNTIRVSSSHTEAINMLEYLRSKFVRFIIDQTHFGKGNNKTTVKFVPEIDFTRSWTDEELYAHFNLTDEEIKLIEDTTT